jgi:hypothetical protein
VNHAEALKVVADVQKRWFRQPIPGAALDSYTSALAPLPYGDAMAAVETIASSGAADFPPSAGDIARKVAENQIAPQTWDEVRRALLLRVAEVAAITGQPWRCTNTADPCDGSTWKVNAKREAEACGCREDLIARNRSTDLFDPLVRTWIDQGFLTTGEMNAIAAGDTTTEAQARDRWRDYVARLVSARTAAGMQHGDGVRAIERGRRSDHPTLGRGDRPALGASPVEVLDRLGVTPPEPVAVRHEDVER